MMSAAELKQNLAGIGLDVTKEFGSGSVEVSARYQHAVIKFFVLAPTGNDPTYDPIIEAKSRLKRRQMLIDAPKRAE